MESFNIVMRKDCLRMKRIGMLTSGGDCQALNAAMRGVVKGLSENVDELEIYGFHNGYKGLIYGDYRLLTSAEPFSEPQDNPLSRCRFRMSRVWIRSRP